MNAVTTSELLAGFVERFGNAGILSTSATLVNFTGNLYNVDGSSPDPNIDGESWKGLLLSYGIESDCYVTNETPTGNSHPNFKVGGHMTPNSDGKVAIGADSYLMPLCSWHNSKARDEVAFEHSKTLMLKLSGFLESEVAATFLARLPSEERHSIVFTDNDDHLKTVDLSEEQAAEVAGGNLPSEALGCQPGSYVVFERVERDEKTAYLVKSSSTPAL